MASTHPSDILVFAAAALTALIAAQSVRHVSSGRPELAATARWLGVGLVAWSAVAILASTISFFPQKTTFVDGDLPSFLALNTLIMMLPGIFVVAALASERVRAVAWLVPAYALIGIHVYRLGGGAIVQLGLEGLLPPYMAYTTGFGDMIVGATALPIAVGMYRGWRGARIAAGAWAAFGLLEFTNAVVAVQLSFFGVLQPDIEPAMVGFPPMSTICLFQLPFGVMTHIWLLMRLRRGLA
ncbi:MAG: hypothetical protein AAGM16_07760 [Pseudomonadota bacterium]